MSCKVAFYLPFIICVLVFEKMSETEEKEVSTLKRQISDLQKEVENLKNENKKLKKENTDIVKCMEALTGKTQPYKTVDTSHSTFLISNRFIQFSTSKVIQPINITIALLNSQSAAFGNATTASPLAGSTLTIFFYLAWSYKFENCCDCSVFSVRIV